MMKAASTERRTKPRPGMSVRTQAQASGTARSAASTAVPAPIMTVLMSACQ